MFFILQAIGLPEAGLTPRPSTTILSSASTTVTDFPGAGNRQDPSNPAHDGTRNHVPHDTLQLRKLAGS